MATDSVQRRNLTRFMQEQIGQAPDRLRGLATVDLTDPMGAVREIRRVVDGQRWGDFELAYSFD